MGATLSSFVWAQRFQPRSLGGGPTTDAGAASAAPSSTTSGTGSLPQFEQGVEYAPRDPSYTVSLSLEDADLAELVRVIGQLTGKRFIFGGKVRNIKATVFAPQKVTVAEAYQAFLSILETNGLSVVPHGRFLKIVETGGIASQATPIYGTGQAAPSEDRYVTRLLRLAHAVPDEVAGVLGHFKSKDGDITTASGNLLIITDTGANIRRMMQIIEEIDVSSVGEQLWIEPVNYASAAEIASRINDIFELRGGAKAGDKGGAVSAGTGDVHVTKVVSDDRSNSLLIVATEHAYLRILELVKRLDLPQTGEGEVHVVPLQHADAVELTKTLNELVSGAAAATRGPTGTPSGQTTTPSASLQNQVFEAGIKLSADKATNSIVITSSLRDFAALRVVIDRLDMARRQVFIEAVIMDLSVTRTKQLGTDFHVAGLAGLTGGGQSLLYGGLNPLETVSPIGSDTSVLQGLADALLPKIREALAADRDDTAKLITPRDTPTPRATMEACRSGRIEGAKKVHRRWTFTVAAWKKYVDSYGSEPRRREEPRCSDYDTTLDELRRELGFAEASHPNPSAPTAHSVHPKR